MCWLLSVGWAVVCRLCWLLTGWLGCCSWKNLVPSHSKRRAQQRKQKMQAQREQRDQLRAQQLDGREHHSKTANIYYSGPPVAPGRRMDAGSATAALHKLLSPSNEAHEARLTDATQLLSEQIRNSGSNSAGSSPVLKSRPPGRRNQV